MNYEIYEIKEIKNLFANIGPYMSRCLHLLKYIKQIYCGIFRKDGCTNPLRNKWAARTFLGWQLN